MDDEKLITLVESRNILYNKFNKDYRMPDKKRAAWSQISKEVGVAEELCMKRWTSLRDRYAKKKRNEKLASGSGADFTHRWHYMEQLEFLAPHVVSRPVRSTINIIEQSTPIVKQSFEILQDSLAESQTLNTSFFESQTQDSSFFESQTQDSLVALPAATPEALKRRKTKKRTEQYDDGDQIFAEAVDTFKKFCKSKEEKDKQKESDTIHAFGRMVAATLNSFNENKQARGIKLITEVLMQLKVEPN